MFPMNRWLKRFGVLALGGVLSPGSVAPAPKLPRPSPSRCPGSVTRPSPRGVPTRLAGSIKPPCGSIPVMRRQASRSRSSAPPGLSARLALR